MKYKKYEDKATQRAKLKELLGSRISCNGKFTQGLKTTCSGEVRRLILDITVYLREGKKLYLHHMWIPEKKGYYFKYEKKYLDFKADVKVWGTDEKATLENIFVKEYRKKKLQ